jgi:hypothetical protein
MVIFALGCHSGASVNGGLYISTVLPMQHRGLLHSCSEEKLIATTGLNPEYDILALVITSKFTVGMKNLDARTMKFLEASIDPFLIGLDLIGYIKKIIRSEIERRMIMFKEVISQLYDFAHDNDLYIEFRITNDECAFVLQDRDRTWAYNRIIHKEHIAYSSFDSIQYAEYVVNRVREKLLAKGVIECVDL